MSQEVLNVIDKIKEDIARLEAGLNQKKQMVNMLAEHAGLDPVYSVADLTPAQTSGKTAFKADQFYGQPLATAVRFIMEARKSGGGEKTATVDELYSDLLRGGYAFENKDQEISKRGLRISLTKNPVFHHIGQGRYGLTDWYPTASSKRRERTSTATDDMESPTTTTENSGNGSE